MTHSFIFVDFSRALFGVSKFLTGIGRKKGKKATHALEIFEIDPMRMSAKFWFF